MGCPRGSKLTDRDAGFTLLELLIVVAVIGIIAAISVPAFLKMKTKSKTAVIITDFRTIRDAALQYNMDNNVYPPDTGPGVYPPEFKDYLSSSFHFANPDPIYSYDWENWTGADGNPGDGGTGIAVGFSVHTADALLGPTLSKRFPLEGKQTAPDTYTFTIVPVTP
jgi:prepilin-type N-terminal cleavage/methylation domain-containing protein